MSWFWLDVVRKKPGTMVVDLGYQSDERTWQRYDLLREKLRLGKRRFVGHGHGRLIASIPPTKQTAAAALGIVERSTYFGTSHSFEEPQP